MPRYDFECSDCDVVFEEKVSLADLEKAGLLYAPHTSAGRLPTDAGLRIFVDGLLEVGNLTQEEKTNLEIVTNI